MSDKLSHLDNDGSIHMINVSSKMDTQRMAVAKGEVVMLATTYNIISSGMLIKGDILSVAQVAGVLAAKQTANFIPLCHTLPLTYIDVKVDMDPDLPGVVIKAQVETTGKTGVEMEALTAVSVAALTVYDMAKAVDKTIRINNIRLIEKHGGKSGDIINE